MAPLPGGKWLFSRLLGTMVPYTGSIQPLVDTLEPGYSRILLKDRRKVRNHLKSIHAIALVNLGEISTGLAMLYGLPDNARGIVTGISIEYLKKARGTLVGECRCRPPATNERQEYLVHSEITDADHDVVARVTAKWLIGPLE